MRYVLPLLLIPFVLSGCSIGGSSSKPTPAAVGGSNVYTDPVYHFSFHYPSSWHVPARGKYQSIGGVRTYVVDLKTPGNEAGAQITVDKQLVPFSTIPEGKVAPDPRGGPDTFHYHHLTVSGWPALQVQRFTGTTVDSYDTITNTHQYSYDVRMVTAQPPFSSGITNGYHTVVHSIQLPF